MSSSSRPSRKRKQRENFSPLRPQEETDLARAINISLRRIPDNNNLSEDDLDEADIIQDESELEEEFVEDKIDQLPKDDYKVKWSRAPGLVSLLAFNQKTGPTKSLPSSKKEKHFFELLFSKGVFSLLQKQTNLYAKQRMQIHPDPDWKPTTVAELKAWIGCLIAMGLNKLPTIKMYWESPWEFSLVTKRFTRNRFLSIKKYLHLADNSGLVEQDQKASDPLAKVRPLLNVLIKNFKANYNPSLYLTVDEDMCKFKGRHRIKQYMRAKIIKWGYKIWKLCDANTAYVLDLDIYTGKNSRKSLPYEVVFHLMEGYLDKQHIVVMDNYFTSVPLFLDLLARSTYACGTVRSDRKYLPEEFKREKKREPGDSDYWQSGNLVATVWQDKRAVRFLSTCCEPEGSAFVTRRRKDSKSAVLNCPPVTKVYSSYMGGVDKSDRMVRTYSVSRRSKKWWYRLFYYLLDTSLANSYILYKKSLNHIDVSELEYLKNLALSLIGTVSVRDQVQPRSRSTKVAVSVPPRVSTGNHWPVLTKNQKACVQCATPGKRPRRSNYLCEGCNVHLCINKCFKRYHTRA
jgi:hypothetical protein